MNKEILVDKLLSLNYPVIQAPQVADELLTIDDSLAQLLKNWIDKSVEADVNIEGFSLLDLKNKYNMTYPAALLTMDWLLKEPQIALKAITHGIM